MSLKRLFNATRTIGFKVTAWYSIIFTLSSLCLFFIAYFFLSSTLGKQNYEEILLELREISMLYEISGIEGLEKFIVESNHTRRASPLLVRVADRNNSTLHISSPEKWPDFDLNALEKYSPHLNRGWIHIPSINDEYVLAVKSAHFSTGYWIQVGISCENTHKILDQFRKFFLIAMVPLFITGLIGGMVLSHQTRRPIRNIINTVQLLDFKEMTEKVPLSFSGDEMDELAALFNKMLENIRRLINGMKNSLDNVAHDLRTPLTRFRNIADMALQGEQNPDTVKEALIKSMEESDHILNMLDTLMDISEAETGTMNIHKSQTDICHLISEIADMYGFVAEEKDIRLEVNLPPPFFLSIDSNRIGQAISNILDNAIKFTGPGGHIYISAEKHYNNVMIKVTDTGIGIPPEELPRIWDRLYRGRQLPSGRGIGLGLSLVKGIIEAHDGHIEVVSETGKGASFMLQLPGAS